MCVLSFPLTFVTTALFPPHRPFLVPMQRNIQSVGCTKYLGSIDGDGTALTLGMVGEV